jgi:hypothetical protein
MDVAHADLMEENDHEDGIVLSLTTQPNQENLEHEGFFLPDNLL